MASFIANFYLSLHASAFPSSTEPKISRACSILMNVNEAITGCLSVLRRGTIVISVLSQMLASITPELYVFTKGTRGLNKNNIKQKVVGLYIDPLFNVFHAKEPSNEVH